MSNTANNILHKSNQKYKQICSNYFNYSW